MSTFHDVCKISFKNGSFIIPQRFQEHHIPIKSPQFMFLKTTWVENYELLHVALGTFIMLNRKYRNIKSSEKNNHARCHSTSKKQQKAEGVALFL